MFKPLKKELEELQVNLDNLEDYKESTEFKTLDIYNQDAINLQLFHMREYKEVLELRMTIFDRD